MPRQQKVSKKILLSNIEKLLATKQDLGIEENPSQRQKLLNRYASLRNNIIYLARELGLPEYGLEAERNRERQQTNKQLNDKGKKVVKKLDEVRKNLANKSDEWIKEMDDSDAKTTKNKFKRKVVDPDGYYYLLIGRGFSPEIALDRVAKKYGQKK